MIKIYHARAGAPFPEEDAQEIGEFIDSLQDKTTEGILDAVEKNKKCILHKYIKWDNREAANLYRLHQIRNIVSHVTIEIKEIGDSTPIRAYYSVKANEDSNKKTYVNVDVAFTHKYYRQQIINRALTELNNWTERYRIYNELNNIINAIDNEINNMK